MSDTIIADLLSVEKESKMLLDEAQASADERVRTAQLEINNELQEAIVKKTAALDKEFEQKRREVDARKVEESDMWLKTLADGEQNSAAVFSFLNNYFSERNIWIGEPL